MAKAKVIALPTARAAVETKDRILDAAETLFMEHGYEATSLRSLTTAADVNLAAVNYHFGTKEELFEALIEGRIPFRETSTADVPLLIEPVKLV